MPPPRIPLTRVSLVSTRYVCATCRAPRSLLSSSSSTPISGPRRWRPFSTAISRRAQSPDDDFYALLLQDPLPYHARSTRVPLEKTKTAPQAPPSSNPQASKSKPVNTSSSSSPSSTATATTSSTSTKSSFDDDDRAARARLVFGSRNMTPEEEAARNREWLARGTIVNGVHVPPRPSEPDNCCMSGCVNCVWDLYREELEEWATARQAAAAAGAASKPEAGGVNVRPGNDAQRAAGGSASAMSMDDDGGGSDTNWDPTSDDALHPTSASDLFNDIPVGIREFMRTEKRLGSRRKQRESLAERRRLSPDGVLEEGPTGLERWQRKPDAAGRAG